MASGLVPKTSMILLRGRFVVTAKFALSWRASGFDVL
jgi:hypothetical protein